MAWAEGLAADGDYAGAVDLLAEGLERAPEWTAGWFRLGEWAEAAGDTPRAIAAFERVLTLDPADRFGAVLRRDLLRPAPLTDTMPAAFVEALFDQYAPRFEASLVDALDYRGPEVLRDAVLMTGRSRFDAVLDLGCGTGLAGAAIAPFADALTGYDLSSEMLKIAQTKGVYAHLAQADLNTLRHEPLAYDLILAADVFNYIGALEGIIAWCANALRDGGLLAFSVEAGAAGVTLQDTRRFTHSASYIQGLLHDAGFAHCTLTPTTLRRDRGQDVQSLVVVAGDLVRAEGRQTDGEEAEVV